jgi:uncharacterized protein (TIGR03086 family)
MSNQVSMFRRAQLAFGDRVLAVQDDQWAAPTPCDEWTVTDLVAHLVDEQLWVPPLLGGHELAEATKIVESTRRTTDGSPKDAWQEAARASLHAVMEPGAIDRSVELSRGSTPASEYINEMVFDLTVHAWDLGVAIGSGDPLPDDVVRYALDGVKSMGDLSGSGLFRPPVSVPDDASELDRLVGITGREPR